MKGIKTLAVLACIAAITIAATDASAYLHPRLGRFLQRDPLGYVDGMHVYEYVRGNPIVSTDPSGRAIGISDFADFMSSLPPIMPFAIGHEPDTSDGPAGMVSAYFNTQRSIDRVKYDESTQLVKAVKASKAYSDYKSLYMDSPARRAALRFSEGVGEVKTCATWPGQSVRNGGWMPTGPDNKPLGLGQNRAWWWQKHKQAFPGFYLNGMLGVSWVEAIMSCKFCQECVKGRWRITGDCTANLSIHETWDLGGNPDDPKAADVVGALGRAIHMYLSWKDSFKIKVSRKAGKIKVSRKAGG